MRGAKKTIIFFQVNKSAGPFDALFCVGQFFPDEPDRLDELMDYVEGRARVPLPTYFIGDYGVGAPKVLSAVSRNSANQGFKMDGFKVCDNLFWLKGSGKFTLHGNFFLKLLLSSLCLITEKVNVIRLESACGNFLSYLICCAYT